jgi:hypothetical protein
MFPISGAKEDVNSLYGDDEYDDEEDEDEYGDADMSVGDEAECNCTDDRAVVRNIIKQKKSTKAK